MSAEQDAPMILRLEIHADEPGAAILAELMADLETREMFVERLEEHMAAAVADAVFDMRRTEVGEYEVVIEGDTVPGLLIALQGALLAVEQGQGKEVAHLLRAAIARVGGDELIS